MSDDKKPADLRNDTKAAPDTPAAEAGPEVTAETDAGGAIGAEQLKQIVSVLQSDLEKKTAELAEKQDQFVRAVAETENVRRRLEREKEETAKYAISKFAKDILSIGDNFQRAIAAVPKDAVDSDPALKSFLDGVVLAERDYSAALERHGVKAIDPKGQPFNPHHHQAVMEQENTEVPNGTVLQVYQVGYLIDDRCLRPAMVVVSRGGPKTVKSAEGEPQTPPPAND